jgi:hypothetical protein
MGYLITDWGDGGHPQPLAVSWLPFAAGAAMAWCGKTFKEASLIPALSRDVFRDPSKSVAKAAWALGMAHRKLHFTELNLTPLGAVIAAPPPEERELFCRNGLKYFARIKARNIQAAARELRKQLGVLEKARRDARISPAGKILVRELELAARMAEQSCKFMLWQQTVAQGNALHARQMAKDGIVELARLEKDFDAFWPKRNKGTTKHCSPFLQWRMADYQEVISGAAPKRRQ